MRDRIASLAELETTWSLDDAMRAYAVLQLQDDVRDQERRDARKGAGVR